MNNRTNYKIAKNNVNNASVIYIMLLVYIGIGSYLMMNGLPSSSYFDIFNYSFGSTNFILFFLAPTFFILGIINFIFNENNDCIYLRFKSKNDYFKFQIANNFATTSIFYVLAIIIVLIFVNCHGSLLNSIKNDYSYNIPNVIVSIVIIVKVYLFMLAFQMLNIFLFKLLKSRVIHFTILFVILFIINNSYLLGNLLLIKFILPIAYIGFNYIFSTVYYDVIFSTLYYLSVIILFWFATKRIIIKKDVGCSALCD